MTFLFSLPWWVYPVIVAWLVIPVALSLCVIAKTADLAAEVLYERERRRRS